MKTIKSLLTLCFTVFYIHGAFSQYYTTKQYGDFNSRINCMFQDSFSTIWLGTSNGVITYDGNKFETINWIFKNITKIQELTITDIIEDNNKNIWLTTENNGIVKIARSTGVCEIFQESKTNKMKSNIITEVTKDNDGELWFGSILGGLNKYDSIKNIVENIPMINGGFHSIYSITSDSERNLIFSTEKKGICVYNKTTKSINTTTYKKLQKILSPYFIEKLGKISNNILYFLLADKGVVIYNEKSKHINCINSTISDSISIKFNNLFKDKNGNLVISTEKNLMLIDTSNKKIKPYQTNINIQNNGAKTISTLKTQDGCIWISTNNEKLFQLIPSQNFNYYISKSHVIPFKDEFILDVKVYQKKIWVIIRNKGIFTFNPKNYKINRINLPSNYSSGAKRLYIDKDHNLWIGTDKGLLIFNSKTKSINNYYKTPHDLDVLKGAYTYSIMQDRKRNVWIGTFNIGVYLYINKSHKIKKIHITKDEKIPNESILALFEKNENEIWIGVWNSGVKVYNYKSDSISNLPNLNNYLINNPISPNIFFEDSKKNIWIGTVSQGLIKYAKNITIFDDKTGLPDNFINYMTEDEKHNLWISTDKGITKLNIHNNKLINYDKTNGLVCQTYIHMAGDKDKNGLMYFGGRTGLTVFNPNDINNINVKKPIYITNVFINNKSAIKSNKKVIFNKIHFLDILSNSKTNISFSFNEINYTKNKQNRFAYKLIGYENTWHNTSTTKSIEYNNIKPGKYTFKVKLFNNDISDKSTYTSLTINVVRPVWIIILKVSLIILLFILIAYAIKKNKLAIRFNFTLIKSTLKKQIHSNKKQLIIIEDNESIISELKNKLSSTYSLINTCKFNNALTLIKKSASDMIIIDEEFCKTLNENRCNTLKLAISKSHIPTIILTNNTSSEFIVESNTFGISDIIIKPISFKFLTIKIKNRLLIQDEIKNKSSNLINNSNDIFLDKIVQFIYENIANPNLNVELICKEIGLSRSSLYSKFKDLTDMTINEFIKDIRMKKAIELLKIGNLSIYEIAYKTGYNDPNYFSRVFSNKYGVPPSKYFD